MNAFTQGKSGGDVCMSESLKRMRNAHVTVVTSQLGKELCLSLRLKADFYVTSKEKKFQNVLITYLLRALRGIQLILSKNQQSAKIIYVSSDAFSDVLPAIVYKIKYDKAKWLQKIYHVIPKERAVSYFAQRLSFSFIKKYASVIIVDNEQVKKELKNFGFKEDSLRVNYPGVQIPKIKSSIKKYDAVYIGRLHKSKGIYDLLTIWKNILQIRPNLQLAIIGNGDHLLEKKLRQIEQKSELKNITWVGHVSEKDKWSMLKSSSVFITSSHEEGFGMSILEALASGIPVVTYDLPAYQVFGESISTVIMADREAFVKQVVDVLENRGRYVKQIQKGIDLAKQFTWEKYSKIEERIILDSRN